MGILAGILGNSNPLAQWTLQNHNWLSSIGAGIGSGKTFEEGLSNATWQGPQGQRLDAVVQANEAEKAAAQDKIKQSAADLQKWPDLVKYVTDTGDTKGAFMEAFNRSAPGYGDPNYGKPAADPTDSYAGRLAIGKANGLTGTDLGNYAMTGNLPGDRGNSKFGNTPVMATDGKGNWIAVQPGSDGTTNQMQFPTGFHPDPGGLAGTKTEATVDAKSAAAARAALPGAQQAFDMANKAADALLGDTAGQADQFGNTLGFPNQMMPFARPGSDMARFRTELAQGQGNAFLQARQVLKGAGQVTDYEGAKAESAYSRMVLASQQNNQQEFVAAVSDFKQAVAEGMQKLQAAANGDYKQGGSGVTGQPSGNVTSSGVQWSVSP